MRNLNQNTQTTTLTAEEVKTLKDARQALWQAYAIINIMSQSNYDEPMDYAVALEGVSKLMLDNLCHLSDMNI
ncbi:hypothetical protein EV694_0300 [Volucribacter psittacicida]|uniref:Uncharacterized protein n=1 Tax=Volucribacter psittacicida TaxID=203482 RepID=A0A4R1G7P5_9PAST|nr:hypothetical protein [Volucribacter psittacicida]TCK01679.1 hypothetical protein EV694_0300 [Volucribacter psittacicida]